MLGENLRPRLSKYEISFKIFVFESNFPKLKTKFFNLKTGFSDDKFSFWADWYKSSENFGYY